MAVLHVLRVFANEDGEWGNPLGVFLDGSGITVECRPRIAAQLGFSETVFVEDRGSGRIRIHTPEVELPFAGHPTVGTAWLMTREGSPVPALMTDAGRVGVRVDGSSAYATAPPEWAPDFEYVQLGSPADVRALRPDPRRQRNLYAWAWIDEAAGTLGSRAFVPLAGIEEDEATGSAALALCASLGRPIVIHQGHGSVLQAKPSSGGRIEVGGRVVLDEMRRFETGIDPG